MGVPDTFPDQPNGTAMFRRTGDYWTLAYHGEVVRLRDAKGLRYLAHLLGHPGEAIPAATLVAAGHRPVESSRQALEPPAPSPEHARVAVTKRIKETIKRIAANHPTLGYHLRAAVRTGYRCCYEPEPGWAGQWEV